MTPGKPINWSILAAVRFFLAFIVLNHHMPFFAANAFSAVFGLFGGKAAVVGFLLISGYSVSASFQRRRDGFLYRRFLRIYPAYFVVVALAIALQHQLGAQQLNGLRVEPSDPVTVAGNFAMLQSYFVRRIDFDPPLWSLSIEFSFYLLLLFIERVPRWCILAATLLSLVFFLLPEELSGHHLYQLAMKANMVRYLWPFLIGVLLFQNPSGAGYLLAGLAGVAALLMSPWTYESLSWLTFAIVVIATYVSSRGFGKRSVILEYLGDVSYPLYLLHFPLCIALFAILHVTSGWIYIAAALAASVIVTSAIEAPLRMLLARAIGIASFRRVG